jgi:hypothetical protein
MATFSQIVSNLVSLTTGKIAIAILVILVLSWVYRRFSSQNLQQPAPDRNRLILSPGRNVIPPTARVRTIKGPDRFVTSEGDSRKEMLSITTNGIIFRNFPNLEISPETENILKLLVSHSNVFLVTRISGDAKGRELET